MGSEPCATYLESNLALVRGIEKVTADPYGKEAEVTFDARQLSLRNVEHHIARFGFDVDARPLQHETDQPYRIEANAANKSRLPPECQ